MMSSAEGSEIARMGLARRPAVVGVDVWLDVVEVAGPSGLFAVGEDAGAVAQDDEFAHPFGWVVGVDGVGAAYVKDRTDQGDSS